MKSGLIVLLMILISGADAVASVKAAIVLINYSSDHGGGATVIKENTKLPYNMILGGKTCYFLDAKEKVQGTLERMIRNHQFANDAKTTVAVTFSEFAANRQVATVVIQNNSESITLEFEPCELN
ncbi:MAG: hypothetical protein IT289_11250 [Oligoflexia bacterium]|nr:hypothetical protein [Oligoflexia bacterium]